MNPQTVVELSGWQFAASAMLHFIFLALTLGLSLLLAGLETAFAVGGRSVYQTLLQPLRRLFAHVFLAALGMRLLLLAQFGLQVSYFSLMVGDVLALPLMLEVVSLLLAALLLLPYYRSGQQAKTARLALIWGLFLLLAAAAYWFQVANAWLNDPVAAEFNPQSYRFELADVAALLLDSGLIPGYLNLLAAGCIAAASVLLACCVYGRQCAPDEAQRSGVKWAAATALLAACLAVAGFVGRPTPLSVAEQANTLPSIEAHIDNGVRAYAALLALRDESQDPQVLADFNAHRNDLGYAWLLLPWHKNIVGAGDKAVAAAAKSALPPSPNLLLWGNRGMWACAVLGLLGFVLAAANRMKAGPSASAYLSFAHYAAPLAWLASLIAWALAEAGRQPWAAVGRLPAFLSASSLSFPQWLACAAAFVAAYALILAMAGLGLRRAFFNPAAARGGE